MMGEIKTLHPHFALMCAFVSHHLCAAPKRVIARAAAAVDVMRSRGCLIKTQIRAHLASAWPGIPEGDFKVIRHKRICLAQNTTTTVRMKWAE